MIKKVFEFLRKILLNIFAFFKKLFTGKYQLGKKIKIAFFSFIGIFRKNKININDKNYKTKV